MRDRRPGRQGSTIVMASSVPVVAPGATRGSGDPGPVTGLGRRGVSWPDPPGNSRIFPVFPFVAGAVRNRDWAMAENLRIHDLPLSERPRERLRDKGASALTHEELLAILLRTGTAGISALEVGRQLLRQFGTLQRIAAAQAGELGAIRGVGPEKAVTLAAAFELARRIAREAQGEAPLLDTPEQVAAFLREEVRLDRVERLHALFLNTRRRLVGRSVIADGTLDTLLVHPREVFLGAIVANAASIVLAHNHPSGDPTPSEADIKVTRDLIRGGQLLRIEVVDHVILLSQHWDKRIYAKCRIIPSWLRSVV